MISIGLPAIKHQFLAEAIRSVLDQTYTDFELIIFNDRSEEMIRNIVNSFEDHRIRYFEGGSPLAVVENWNRVLSFAAGEYFVLFADDDRYHPEFLAEMIVLTGKYPSCDIFHCRVRKIDPAGELLAYTSPCPEYETGPEFIYHRLNGEREQFAPEFAVRTKRLRETGGFAGLPLAWGTDDLTWFRLATGGGIAYNPRPLADWRQSPLQISEIGDVAARLQAVDEYSAHLRSFMGTIIPSTEEEKAVIDRIRSLYGIHSDRQKAHLVAVNARHTSCFRQAVFFLRYRNRHRLKFQWLFYSCYAKLTGTNKHLSRIRNIKPSHD